jgi:hypothetical protein
MTDCVEVNAIRRVSPSGTFLKVGTAPATFDAQFEHSTVYDAWLGRYVERTTMGLLRIDRRREQRTPIDITPLVWGVDTHGERFLQEAQARDISLSGALLSGLETDIRSGDVIGILCAGGRRGFEWCGFATMTRETRC